MKGRPLEYVFWGPRALPDAPLPFRSRERRLGVMSRASIDSESVVSSGSGQGPSADATEGQSELRWRLAAALFLLAAACLFVVPLFGGHIAFLIPGELAACTAIIIAWKKLRLPKSLG